MAITFSRSVAALRADGHRVSLVWLLVGTVLLGLWVAWFFFSTVGLYETTSTARLEVGQASHPVQASVSGRVVRTNLALDRAVKAGDVLVELESENEQLQLKESQARSDAYKLQLAALHKEIAAEEQAMQLALETRHAALKEARAKQKESQVVAHFTEEKAKRLDRLRGGQVAELDLLKAQAEAQKNKAGLDTLRHATRRQDRQQQTEVGDRRANLEKLRSEAVRIGGEMATLAAAIQRLQHEIEKRRIRAPISGRLGEIARLAVGAYVKEGARLAAVVPEGKLRGVAEFSATSAMGRIRPGQPTRIRLHGFPWTQYGSVRASVAQVGSETSEGQVRVELELHPGPDCPIPLQHGLPAEVEVEVDRVSPAVLVLRAAGKLLTPDAPPAPPAAGGTR
jgi:multidrug resistance efflux pump